MNNDINKHYDLYSMAVGPYVTVTVALSLPSFLLVLTFFSIWSHVHTKNNVEAVLSNAISQTILSTK